MAMRLSAVKARTKRTTVEWQDESVEVSYRPAAVTPNLLDKVQEAADEDNMAVVGLLLSEVVEWWDVMDDDDQRLAPTPENIGEMPVPFLMAVMAKVQEDERPNGTKGTGPVDRHRR